LVDILVYSVYNKHMNTQKLNNLIQWTGTLFILVMYVLMSYFPQLHPWNIVMGLLGGCAYFAWTIRVKNYPQMVVNVVAITLCLGGLYKHFG
jgi:hypothetical protein